MATEGFAGSYVETHDYRATAAFWAPEHWGMMSTYIRDPDGHSVNLQAPLPSGVVAPGPDNHG